MKRAVLLALATSVVAAESAIAQPGCYDTGHSVRCRAGCQPLTLPRFAGDAFTWRCRRPAPPPPRYTYEPPPNSCPPNMYPVTADWCCPIDTVYRNGRCVYPRQQSNYEASGPDDPTPLLTMLGIAALIFLAWYDQHARQLAIARETEDVMGDTGDIESATERMNAAADEADDILRRFRDQMSEDGE